MMCMGHGKLFSVAHGVVERGQNTGTPMRDVFKGSANCEVLDKRASVGSARTWLWSNGAGGSAWAHEQSLGC